MKAVLISIQPKWCELSASGKKTIEVRKTRPKIDTPFKCYIYCSEKELLTKSHCDGRIYIAPKKKYKQALENVGNITLSGKVIGEFVCDNIICSQAYYGNSGEKHLTNLFGVEIKDTCLCLNEIFDYIIGKDKKDGTGWLWHISELKIYDKPKELGEFRKLCIDKYQYCQSCKYGLIVLSPDEEEYAMYHGGYYDTFDTVCTNRVTRPPQSWCNVEELL